MVLALILWQAAVASASFEVQEALDYCVDKAKVAAAWWDGRPEHPRSIEAGDVWDLHKARRWVWTHGFWPGVLWMSYEAGAAPELLAAAEEATANMERFTHQPARDHDLGFMIMGSIGKAYEREPTLERRKQIIRSAEALYQLIDPDVGTLFSWPAKAKRGEYAPYNTIIDSLLNQELFFRASELSGEGKYREAAIRHADRLIATHVRPNGSTYHLAVYDDVTGIVLQRTTHQGFAAESTWARGQAWGIYGYAMCYRETGLDRYRETAIRLARFFMENLPESGVPFWDFNAPGIPDAPRDASAAAIVAGGLLILAEADPEDERSGTHLADAETLLTALWEECRSDGANLAFLSHSTGNHPRGSEVDVPLIYADYYFIEALLLYRRLMEGMNRGE